MIFILVLLAWCEAAAPGPSGPQTDKNADLLEVIKLNLRKNNDDYSDVSIANKTTHNATASRPRARAPFAQENNNTGAANLKGMRRANDDSLIDSAMIDNILDFGYSPSKNNTNLGPRKNGIFKRFRGNQMIKPIERSVISKSPVIVTTAATPVSLIANKTPFTKSRDHKLEKVRKFYEKNKHLLKEFLSSKIAARTSTTTTTSNKPTWKVDLRYGPPPKKRPVPPLHKGVLSRGQNWLGEEDNRTEPPNPDLLDMMPAVGGRIHFRRIEGRLCHRHVIIPEGPKYDSAGRVYLAAHAAAVRRPYPVTRRPALLLPKCCNCCKKSVLGCE